MMSEIRSFTTSLKRQDGGSVEVHVDIDIGRVAFALIHRAINNKSGQATALDKGVRVRVGNTQRGET